MSENIKVKENWILYQNVFTFKTTEFYDGSLIMHNRNFVLFRFNKIPLQQTLVKFNWNCMQAFICNKAGNIDIKS